MELIVISIFLLMFKLGISNIYLTFSFGKC